MFLLESVCCMEIPLAPCAMVGTIEDIALGSDEVSMLSEYMNTDAVVVKGLLMWLLSCISST